MKNRTLDPKHRKKALMVYFVTVLCFIVHVYEEYYFGFEKILSAQMGQEVTQQDFLTFAIFIVPFILILGAILVIQKWSWGYYYLLLFFAGLALGECSHFTHSFTLYGEWRYTAGVATAIFPILAALYGLFVLLKGRKTA